MQRTVNPRQTRLFDVFDPVLTPQAQQRLLDGWPGMFRHVILELMPVGALGSHLSSTMGRPSIELYSMAGLILLMEQMNWTKCTCQALMGPLQNHRIHYNCSLTYTQMGQLCWSIFLISLSLRQGYRSRHHGHW